MRLFERLKAFQGTENEVILNEQFEQLAPAFLYGGYLQVRNDYKIFIRTLEFYFHSEKENGIHDPIVYHRNTCGLNNVPYFPIMTLHAHTSGFDITFENSKEQYRASALIRAYEIKGSNDKYLKWEKTPNNKWMFIEKEEYQFNTQSTYLYTIMNGFDMGYGSGIKWIDKQRPEGEPIKKTRSNVFKSLNTFEYKPCIDENGQKVKCTRKWSFTRTEEV